MRLSTVVVFSCAVGAAWASVGAQSARPVPTGPVNVIRLASPGHAPATDTSRTVFYTGPRPAAPPAEDVPGHELVVWRSSSPIVRGVAGADAGYLAAFAPPEAAEPSAAIGRGAGPIFLGGGFWPVAGGGGRGGRRGGPAQAPAPAAPRVVGGDLPRPWIGGVQWNLPATPVVEPARNTAIYPVRRP